MKRTAPILIILALAALLFPVAVFAQVPAGCVQVFAAGIKNSSGVLEASGTISFAPVSAAGVPISFLSACGGVPGQTSDVPITVPIKNGAFTIALPDVSLTNPPNICFSVVAKETGTGDRLLAPGGYACLQPHGTPQGTSDWCQADGCHFDAYVPTFSAPTALYGPPDLMTMWNMLIATNGPVSTSTAVDSPVVTFNAAGAPMSAFTLPLYTPAGPSNNCGSDGILPLCYATADGITARTINVIGLTAGTYFAVLINPLHTTAPISSTAQMVTFGTGCNWQFAPGRIVMSGTTLTIPSWAMGSYLAIFQYDGANCIGAIGD
jgi:hypothetical protein